MADQLRDEVVRNRVRECAEFLLPTDVRARSFRAEIILMLNRGQRRLTVSIDEVRAHSRELAYGLLNDPFNFAPCFDRALKDVITTLPDRPPRESKEDVVRRFQSLILTSHYVANFSLGILLCFRGKLRRVCM
jgi:DNA replication licensing factor MCM3